MLLCELLLLGAAWFATSIMKKEYEEKQKNSEISYEELVKRGLA